MKGLIKPGELLDAMGCIKRLAPLHGEKQTFLDLSDMALRPWLVGITKDDSTKLAYEAFVSKVRRHVSGFKSRRFPTDFAPGLYEGVSSHLLFLNKELLAEELEPGANMEKIWRLRQDMAALTPPIQSPYAAVIVGDGDHMGTLIDAIKTQEGHEQFAVKLSEFASKAGETVAFHGGGLIYSGGDDVMAYLPLDTVLSCCEALRCRFNALMAPVHEGLCLGETAPKPTFSIGVALVHHKAPLDGVLALAAKAERQAKEEGGRNALAIIRSKRSGADVSVCGKFDAEGELPGITERLKRIVKLFRGSDAPLPSRLGYQLRDASRLGNDVLAYEVKEESIKAGNAMSVLVKQIFTRKNQENQGVKGNQWRFYVDAKACGSSPTNWWSDINWLRRSCLPKRRRGDDPLPDTKR